MRDKTARCDSARLAFDVDNGGGGGRSDLAPRRSRSPAAKPIGVVASSRGMGVLPLAA